MSTTARILITDALSEIGASDPGEAIDATLAQFAIRTLNRTLARLNLSKGFVYTYLRQEFALVNGTESYTFGAGGTFSATNAGTIVRAGLLRTDTNTETDLQMIDYRGWADLNDRDSTGTPCYIYDSRTAPLDTIYFWPKPDSSNYKAVLYTESEVAEVATIDDVMVIPSAYEELILTEIAIAMCPALKAMPSEILIARNSRAWNAVIVENTQRLEFNPSCHFRRDGRDADITTGRLL